MLEEIQNRLIAATTQVGGDYIAIPMDGRDAQSLERVYAYELYHQLRCATNDIGDYSWGGEVDKSAHPHFNRPGLENKKPDLLYHRPGDHEGNMVVIEIKTSHGIRRRRDVEKDLTTLTAFRQDAGNFLGYQWAVYLVVGGFGVDQIKEWGQELADEDGINLNLIDLYWHPAAGEPARHVEW